LAELGAAGLQPLVFAIAKAMTAKNASFQQQISISKWILYFSTVTYFYLDSLCF
jgi:hypothetical protein